MQINTQDVSDRAACRQLGLPFYGKSIDVDGLDDPKSQGQIRYIGKAAHVFDNLYWCLANVGGSLCVVEVSITPAEY